MTGSVIIFISSNILTVYTVHWSLTLLDQVTCSNFLKYILIPIMMMIWIWLLGMVMIMVMVMVMMIMLNNLVRIHRSTWFCQHFYHSEYIARHGRMSEGLARRKFHQMVAAVEYCHSRWSINFWDQQSIAFQGIAFQGANFKFFFNFEYFIAIQDHPFRESP